MKHVKQDFSSKARDHPLDGIWGGTEALLWFHDMVNLQIILKEMTHAATSEQIFAQRLSPRPWGSGVKISIVRLFTTWSCCLSNLREWRMQQHTNTYSELTHILDPWVGSKVNKSESSHVAYQMNGNGA